MSATRCTDAASLGSTAAAASTFDVIVSHSFCTASGAIEVIDRYRSEVAWMPAASTMAGALSLSSLELTVAQ